MIPVDVLTGFLGSGKTTLLARLLNHPGMGRTAVIVNEFGEIGIDHDLLASSDENFVQLSNGCLCCRIRSDLVDTLLALDDRSPGADTGFTRVVIETSGLADPGPILHALMTDAGVRQRYEPGRVIATIDGILGDETLGRYVESARQVALADSVVITKIDRHDARPAAIEAAVRAMRPDVEVVAAARGEVEPTVIFGRDARRSRATAWVPLAAPYNIAPVSQPASHTPGIESVAIVRDRPLHAATLSLFLAGLAENLGQDLIRIKGIVAVVEDSARPAVIHGVQHVYEPPGWLPDWPSADRRTRIVCIGRRLNGEWIRLLLDLLDEEVAEVAGRHREAAGSRQRPPASLGPEAGG